MGEWYDILEPVFTSQDFYNVAAFLAREKKVHDVWPETTNTFRAFSLCQPKDLKVIIIGQDPYHDKYRATGLSFANAANTTNPSPSLRNIFDEVERQFETLILDRDVTLESWAKQGVLLLNTALSVREGQPESHMTYWRPVTEAIIRRIYAYCIANKQHIHVLLWGRFAQKVGTNKGEDNGYVRILTAPHPSPLAGTGFQNNGHFITVNNELRKRGRKTIDWF